MASSSGTAASSIPRLRRTLTLWDLILYGVIVIQPVSPMSVFGLLSDRGRPLHLRTSSRRRRFFLPPLLRSPDVQYESRARWDFDRRAHLHRFRWHLDAFRRSRESAPQYSPRHCLYLPGDWHPFGVPGLRGAIGLARVAAFSECGYCVRPRGRTNLGPAVRDRGIDASSRKLRFRHGRADRSRSPALRYGT